MNFAAFDLNLLRVFDALMRERSATRAGAVVGLSQPAVSAALNRLRHALGDQLFVRKGAAMEPTPRAEALERPIRDALAQLEQTLNADALFDPAASERTYTVLATDFFSLVLFPALAERLAREAPKVRLRVLELPRDGIERPLLEGGADLALERFMDGPPWMQRRPLFHSAFGIIAARGHPDITAAGVAPGEVLPLDLYSRLPHVLRTIEGDLRSGIDEALAELGRERRVALAVPQFQGVLLAVARSRMIAAVPEQMARLFGEAAGVAVYRSPLKTRAPRIDMVWHRRHDANPAHRWMRDLIAETLAAEGI